MNDSRTWLLLAKPAYSAEALRALGEAWEWLYVDASVATDRQSDAAARFS